MEELTIIIICLVLLILQLLLCFKVKNLLLRLLPAILLLAALAVSLGMTVTATGWDSLGYIAFVFLSAIFLIPCVMGWGIWFIGSRFK